MLKLKAKLLGIDAFVETVAVLSDEDAKKAIEMFNGKDLEGRKMIVNEARPQKPRNF